MGIEVDDATLRVSDDSIGSKADCLPEATESGTELLRNMYRQNRKGMISSADVLRAINSVPPGPAHRAFILMGTTAEKVSAAANDYIVKQIAQSA